MTKGISNLQIEKAFKQLNDQDIEENFVGVFPANRVNWFIDYKAMISEKEGKYPFIIANAEWWNIMDTEPKTDLLFFDTFGVDGLKSFRIQDDQKVIEKMLFGTEQLTRTDKKMTLVNIKFSLDACKNLSKNELDNLSDTARDFFYFVQSFGDKLKLRDFVNL